MWGKTSHLYVAGLLVIPDAGAIAAPVRSKMVRPYQNGAALRYAIAEDATCARRGAAATAS